MSNGDVTDAPVYREPEGTVRPGDIVRLAPMYRALKELVQVGAEQQSKDRTSARLLRGAEIVDPAQGKAVRFVVPGLMTWGVLLTRGCDIDHGKDRQIAFLRPLDDFPSSQRVDIIDGNHTSLHYLPASSPLGGPALPESVIDFRFITTLHRDLFASLERPTSLTRDALRDVYFSWIKHAIGRHVPQDAPCEACGSLVQIFRAVAEVANPPNDY